MRRLAFLAVACIGLLIAMVGPSVANAAFTQCPAVDLDTGCQFLVNVTDAGTTVESDGTQGPYEGADDALMGIVNNSSKPISSIPLSAENELFGFEFDGICSVAKRPSGPSGCKVLPFNSAKLAQAEAKKECKEETVEACGFLPPSGEPAKVSFEESIGIVGFGENEDAVTGYEGPTSWFTSITPGTHSAGVVNFSPALAPGASTYFSLESPPAAGFGTATTLATTLSATSVVQGTPVTDKATLSGVNAAIASGSVSFGVYSDPACKTLVVAAGSAKLAGGAAGPSAAENLAPGKYYWQAHYAGDVNNQPATSPCASELLTVLSPTTTTTIQSTGKALGASLTLPVGTAVSDQALIAGPLAKSATGAVSYALYKDAKCTVPALPGSAAAVVAGVAGASAAVKPPVGTYYWIATYSGDAVNAPSASACGSEVLRVAKKASLGLSSKKGCVSKRKFPIHPRRPNGVNLVSFEEFINGTLVKSGKLSKHATSVNLVGLPKGTFEVELTSKSSKGDIYEDTRTFHTCVPKKHKKH
ncbi:MAG TPA: Ig-like domain-containing protein [Solirubrobacteraceae bacterium]|jgi:hypothetical protein|nr:Ig-like domain-containing protein [Solirubrobacteraceae bacterium]